MTRLNAVLAPLLLALTLAATHQAQAAVVGFKDDQLLLDGQAQPQLFGAELQYFRLRGAYGRNVPRAKVIALWNKALDRMVEAKMNAISFYIPWDFHEYAEGKFDFTGTADEDKDGNPDYPSRDIITFFKLIEQHGIKRIMVRPGPYINAEWGFLGFGAIPKWFHDKYPGSHMVGPRGEAAKLYDYHNPDFLRYTELWFKEVYAQVLKDRIGPGKPIAFLQLDNETNFGWTSIFHHDYGQGAITRYREFLQQRYMTIAAVNAAHKRAWKSFGEIDPPRARGKNVSEDQDWYRFQDESIHSYLEKVRRMWESIGVKEPTVLFTLAESYNALQDGLLPNYKFRNDPGHTGLMTVNLYPKTYDLPFAPLMNLPFKTDHDVKAADSANDTYLGSKQEWVLGPEIQGGWWRGINVTDESRRQTYLSTLGHGMKALFVYYFNEGYNWQVEMQSFPQQAQELYFDSPLDVNADPRGHFTGLKEVGEKLIAPYGDFLGRAREMHDSVCILREDEQHAPSTSNVIDALAMNGDWAGGLLGYLMQTGVNPQILHWDVNKESDLDQCQLILRQDNGVRNAARSAALKRLATAGHTVVNFVDSTLLSEMGFAIPQISESAFGSAQLKASGQTFYVRASPLYRYDLSGVVSQCSSLVMKGTNTIGFNCAVGQGHVIQVGAVPYDRFNSDTYASVDDAIPKRVFLEALLRDAGVKPRVRITGDRYVAFGRTDGTTTMITAKNGQTKTVSFTIALTESASGQRYRVRDIFAGTDQAVEGSTLATAGFNATLGSSGSTVFIIEKVNK